MAVLLTTSPAARHEQFDLWRELVCQRFVPLEALPVERGPFYGALETAPVGGIQVSDLTADPQRVVRARRDISLSDAELLMVCVQFEGTSAIEQDARVARLAPGDLVLFDSTRPYQLRFDERFRQLVLHFPRQRLLPRLAAPGSATAVRVDGGQGVGRLAADFLRSVASQSAALDEHSAPAVSEQVLGLLALAFGAPRAEADEDPDSAVTQARLRKVRASIEERLAEPDLCPARIAAVNHLSVRYLHRLFEHAGGTVGEFIRERRLQRCAEALADPRLAARSISELAFAWGFNDAAHFSRAFKQRFGVSPSEHRARARRGPG